MGYQVRAGGPVIVGRALIALLAAVIIHTGSGLHTVRPVYREESGFIWDWMNLTSTFRLHPLKPDLIDLADRDAIPALALLNHGSRIIL